MALRVYADTSVFGGCEDEEFREGSRRLLQRFGSGRVHLVLSGLTLRELTPAPLEVRRWPVEVPRSAVEFLRFTAEARRLQRAYENAGLVTSRLRADAHHIALATAGRVDYLVRWNFKHIVNHRRIALIHALHLRVGAPTLRICSPLELLNHV
jgi:hypothetical protein